MLPAALFDCGIWCYGFYGLSYEYVAAALPAAELRRAVLAHLGNGASMVAVRDGRSVDTTMGLTPSGGLVMGTRAGDLDPGLLVYLLDHGYDARGLESLVDREGGLLALSGTTSDMQQLLAVRASDPHAALAVDAFCYHARKSIGAFAAVLGGLVIGRIEDQAGCAVLLFRWQKRKTLSFGDEKPVNMRRSLIDNFESPRLKQSIVEQRIS